MLRVGVADRDAVRLKPGDAATVRFDAFPGEAVRRRACARWRRPRIRGRGRTRWRWRCAGGGKPLASGLVGRVEMRPAAGTEMALVPIQAILEADGDAATVYTLAADGRTRAAAAGDASASSRGAGGGQRRAGRRERPW